MVGLEAHVFAVGVALGLFVSLPPGANTALCVRLARQSTADVLAVVTSAALVDTLYSVLSALGVLTFARADEQLLHWLTVAALALAAFLVWPGREPKSLRRASVATALFNPATASLWLGMSATLIPYREYELAPLALGTMLGTASWFLALSFAVRRLDVTLLKDRQASGVGALCSLALVAMALARVATLLR